MSQEVQQKTDEIGIQDASIDIWESKYCLKDKEGNKIDQTVDDTFKRVAYALAQVEPTQPKREKWYDKFLWALRNGATPAGRIMSNAGAENYKPATSTINCTVSGTIEDSMAGILDKVNEAGLTLKSGAGIGYEFSTLRPKGAYVSGAGAYTSGPLSFMDIYDKMCFTVSSAGGRRGAQMATFDVGHPDVMDFIRAKKEDGRLRQFNMSLLITDAFMEAVRHDKNWPLAFPISKQEYQNRAIDLSNTEEVIWRDWPIKIGYITDETGLVACKIYKTIKAKRLWDMIMASTYDYAEPGFILIDKINQENNNWFCETIRATNPCVTADTRLHTQYGMVRIGDLYQSGESLEVTVDKRALDQQSKGTETRNAVPAFMSAGDADIWCVTTEDGYKIKATEWHEFYTNQGKKPLKKLSEGDKILIQSGKGQFGQQGSKNLGMILGLITGDGQITHRGHGQMAAVINLWGEEKKLAEQLSSAVNAMIANLLRQTRAYKVKPTPVADRDMVFIRSVLLARALAYYGFTKNAKLEVPEVIWRGSEDCVRTYLQALFQCDGTVNASDNNQSCAIRLASSEPSLLRDVQTLLANFGIFSRIHKRRKAGERSLPDGNGGKRAYQCRADYELIIDGQSREIFMREVGFLLPAKQKRYEKWIAGKALRKTQRFTSRISAIEYLGRQPVFDTTQNDHNTVIFNGMVTGQCGEQPLPPYGSCLLGSVNLTQFVVNPFSDQCYFDWEKYEQVVSIFTRMLDNVVEINGLPLGRQREEIENKRRHGMGFLGLGSTLTMLKMKYGDKQSLNFTEELTKQMAITGWEQSLALGREKGVAPVLKHNYTLTEELLRLRPEMRRDGYKAGDKVKGSVLHAKYSRYMQRIAEKAPETVEKLAEEGGRFTHHTSIAPTGTISLSLANNASNGIEPSFAHHYSRNVIRQGKKSKEKVDVFSFESLAYRHYVNPEAMPNSDHKENQLPAYFITSETISPIEHVDIQGAAQKWVDSSISKTANVPTEFGFDAFKDIYIYAYEQGLKGCTTFRFNPEVFQGVLVKEQDLKNTTYRFKLEDDSIIEVKGDEQVAYDGEMHTAANLYDALKEGYYGKF